MAVNPLKREEFASLHGIRITEEAFEQLISVESPYRYELIDGLVYDMTGSSRGRRRGAFRRDRALRL